MPSSVIHKFTENAKGDSVLNLIFTIDFLAKILYNRHINNRISLNVFEGDFEMSYRRYHMKKHISFILAAALTVASFPAVTASAAEDESKDFVVLGDSIAAGELRDGFVEHNYGEILADYYNGTVANYSSSGMDSDVLLDTVKKLTDEQKKAVKDAECVVISIGGNDMIHFYCKNLLDYFATNNPQNNMKNFLKGGYTRADIPENPALKDVMEMVDTDSVSNFASADFGNALELLTEIRSAAAKLRNPTNGYIKEHIMPNISAVIDEVKSINPDAQIVVQNIYQPIQISSEYISKTYGNTKYGDIISQLRDVAESLVKSFSEQLQTAAADKGAKVADVLTDFTSMEEGVTQSSANPGHAAYFIDIETGMLSTGDVHPNQKGHLAIASKIITTIGETHNDGGLLSDLYENLEDKASYPAVALATYEAAAGTYVLGDVTFDGIIDGRDATLVLTEYAKTSSGKESSLYYRQKLVSEVTSDSIIDGRDASMILTYYVKASAGSEKGTFEEYIKNNK